MTRRRSSAPGPHRPSRPWSFSIPSRLLPSIALSALLLSACGATAGTAATDPAVPGSSSAAAASEAPAASGLETTGAAPTTAVPAGSAGPSDAAPAPTDTAPLAMEPASDCTGTAENRTFYGSVAAAVGWTVYCPVLPSGWFVEQGSYRLAGGGRLVITYRGPAGAHFTLREGHWCTDGTGCAPAGADGGTTAFGDHEGSLVTGSDGSVAIVVEAGAPVSWELVGDGLDEGTVRMFGAALIAVAG